MDYIKEYRRFVNSYNFAYAIRVTLGVTLPAILLSYFDLYLVGLVASLGAMTVSNADVPGPVHRRFNAMLATMILNFLIAVLVGYCSTKPVLLAIIIAVLCFVLTIIGVYGSRVNTVGFAGLVVMVLTLDSERSGSEVLYNGLYILAGSIWYMLLSLALFRMRPYRIVQQALGDYIFSIGDYLRTRSFFYDENVDYDKTFRNVMEQQQSIHEKQEMLREMIFKSRSIVRQSTTTSRTLLVIFIDTIDLFEKATGTVYNYESMHRRFADTGILQKFQDFILEMADELHEIGLSVQSGRPSGTGKVLNDSLRVLKNDFEVFINEHRSPQNLEPLISMRKVMQSIDDMATRIYTLHHYTRYEKKHLENFKPADNYDAFVEPTQLPLSLLLENLSFKSATFRHALRVSIATTAGYLVALALQLGHSYWVLLTILVILKPSYSLTKQRNYHRLIGTLIGAALGTGLLFLIPDQRGLLAVMVVLMLLTYSYIRTKYFTGVLFMTAYLIIFFFMLDPRNFIDVLENRVIDTAIGSVIAFIATYTLAPSWEKSLIRNYMQEALEKSREYFKTVAASFTTGSIDDITYRIKRKEAFVAQANLSGGFTRMLNEPKSKQHNIKQAHEFTVLINVLNSHIVALADLVQKYRDKYKSEDLIPVTHDITEELTEAEKMIVDEDTETKERLSATELKQDIKDLVEKRRTEIEQGLGHTETRTMLMEYKPIADQFLFISRIAGDIKKLAKVF